MFTSAINWFNEIPLGVKALVLVVMSFVITNNVINYQTSQALKKEERNTEILYFAQQQFVNVASDYFGLVGISDAISNARSREVVIYDNQSKYKDIISIFIAAYPKRIDYYAQLEQSMKNELMKPESTFSIAIGQLKKLVEKQKAHSKYQNDVPFRQEYDHQMKRIQSLININTVIRSKMSQLRGLDTCPIQSALVCISEIKKIIDSVDDVEFEYPPLKFINYPASEVNTIELNSGLSSKYLTIGGLKHCRTIDKQTSELLVSVINDIQSFKEDALRFIQFIEDKISVIKQEFFEKYAIEIEPEVTLVTDKELYEITLKNMLNFIDDNFKCFKEATKKNSRFGRIKIF